MLVAADALNLTSEVRQLEFRRLGHLQVPVVGMGTARTFDVSSRREIAVRRDIMAQCVRHQVTFVDSSPMYGHAEKVVGIGTRGTRDRFQIATKVWVEGRDQGEAQIARSFQLLQTDYIEVLQVHNLVDWSTHLQTLEALKEQGKIGLIGITHYVTSAYPTMMDIMRGGRIDTVQIPYNVGDRACEAELLPLAADLDIGVIVMEPLAKGNYLKGLRRRPDVAPLSSFGIKTWAQALLAWVLSDPRVGVAIPATSRPERIADNALAGSVERLPQEMRDYIDRETKRCL